MPVLCGNLATELLHQRYGRESMPPIVALTANMLESQTEQWVASGMDCCLGKPIDVSELERCLRRVHAGTVVPETAMPEYLTILDVGSETLGLESPALLAPPPGGSPPGL